MGSKKIEQQPIDLSNPKPAITVPLEIKIPSSNRSLVLSSNASPSQWMWDNLSARTEVSWPASPCTSTKQPLDTVKTVRSHFRGYRALLDRTRHNSPSPVESIDWSELPRTIRKESVDPTSSWVPHQVLLHPLLTMDRHVSTSPVESVVWSPSPCTASRDQFSGLESQKSHVLSQSHARLSTSSHNSPSPVDSSNPRKRRRSNNSLINDYDTYKMKREKNNLAARKSREKKKQQEQSLRELLDEYKKNNELLRERNLTLSLQNIKLVERYRKLHINYMNLAQWHTSLETIPGAHNH